jgi:hypothetical protein
MFSRCLTWLLPATIGVVNHERLHNKDADFEYNMYDVLEEIRNYFEPSVVKSKHGYYDNELEKKFYCMGADLFEAPVDIDAGIEVEDNDMMGYAMDDWYNFSSSITKHPASSVYSELLVAMMEITNSKDILYSE